MQIVELEDYSMVIMKDSEDPFWASLGMVYRTLEERKMHFEVVKKGFPDIRQSPSEAICTAGRMILFFKDAVDKEFHVHDKIEIKV